MARILASSHKSFLDAIEKASSIAITVFTNSTKRQLIKNENHWELYVKAKNENNAANIECIAYLEKLSKTKVKIVKGKKNRKKVFLFF